MKTRLEVGARETCFPAGMHGYLRQGLNLFPGGSASRVGPKPKGHASRRLIAWLGGSLPVAAIPLSLRDLFVKALLGGPLPPFEHRGLDFYFTKFVLMERTVAARLGASYEQHT